MSSPSNEERICAMFDSFSKKVSRNFVRNLDKDEYPSDFFVLYVDGHSCVVESEVLYKALSSLPEKQRNVLLLGFWRGLSDGEISERMEVTTRTVYNLRQRAYSRIREYYEKRGRDP